MFVCICAGLCCVSVSVYVCACLCQTQAETLTDTDRHRQTQTHTDTHTDTQTQAQTQSDRDRDRETETETHTKCMFTLRGLLDESARADAARAGATPSQQSAGPTPQCEGTHGRPVSKRPVFQIPNIGHARGGHILGRYAATSWPSSCAEASYQHPTTHQACCLNFSCRHEVRCWLSGSATLTGTNAHKGPQLRKLKCFKLEQF